MHMMHSYSRASGYIHHGPGQLNLSRESKNAHRRLALSHAFLSSNVQLPHTTAQRTVTGRVMKELSIP